MKKLLPFTALAFALMTACGTPPGQLSGGRVSLGIMVTDGPSFVTVTKTFTPATPEKPAVPPSATNPTGTPAVPATPEKTTWTSSAAGSVEFVFSSRPTSDAAYITGYRIKRDVVSYYDPRRGQVVSEDYNDDSPIEKLNIYVPSGWTCPETTALQSCQMYDAAGNFRSTVQPANGVNSVTYSLNLSGSLAGLVRYSNGDVSRTTDIEFIGTSSNGQPVSVVATNIYSRGIKQGDN